MFPVLLWRRKELENYFIDPAFVVHSPFFDGNQQDLNSFLEREATKRVFLDAANYAVIKARDLCRMNWITIARETEAYQNREAAINKLLSRPEFERKLQADQELLSKEKLVHLFETRLQDMIAGQERCAMGQGRWLQLISGKKIMKSLFSLSMFNVTDRSGRSLQGTVKELQIAKSLMKLDEERLPDDFVELRRIVKQRIQS